jgi:DNA-binding NtrC family response regulator
MSSKVLVIEDNPMDAEIFEQILKRDGYIVEIARNALEGLAQAKNGRFDVVLTDLNLGGARTDEGRELVIRVHTLQPHLPVILMTGGHSAEVAIDAIKQGAFDYFAKPADPFDDSFRVELSKMVDHAAASKQLMESRVKLPGEPAPTDESGGDRMIGNSRVMQNVYKEIGRVAPTSFTVLLRGETGTGKELVARAIYAHSTRAEQPFIIVNCTAIPEHLLESELFGHESGSFTGAKTRRIGRFEQAHQGTIFLDEIGDMEPKLQQKLLRVLQAQTIERLGGNQPIPVDVRVIAATQTDLEQAIRANEFRQDLYFRLNVAQIVVPPLRDRREDIPELVQYFIRRYGAELGSGTCALENEALLCLQQQVWAGNVRELRGVVRKALLLAHGFTITKGIVREALDQTRPPRPIAGQAFADHVADLLACAQRGERQEVMAELTELVERELYSQAIQRARGDQTKAAQWLGVSRPTIRQKLTRYGLFPVRDSDTK